ncbi:MAG: ABC transporter permease [Nitrospinota bacterium]
MWRYILRRSVQMVFILWALLTFMFFLFRLIPADPVSIIISAELTEDAQAELRREWGLDRPVSEQYALYLKNLMSGDLGISFYHQEPVWDILSEKLVNTLALMLPATIIAVFIGVSLGMYFGWHRGTRVEGIGMLLPPIIRGIPVFWLGILLLMAFSYKLKLFPNAGMHTLGFFPKTWIEAFFSTDFLRHLVLPLTCTAISFLPESIMIMRSSILETRGEDFLELVEAKGVKERTVKKHAMRNALLPVATWIFHMFGFAITSTVLIEVVFGWPGLGRALVTAVLNLDYAMAQAAFFLLSVLIVTLNFVNDLIYGFLDPRVVIR